MREKNLVGKAEDKIYDLISMSFEYERLLKLGSVLAKGGCIKKHYGAVKKDNWRENGYEKVS